MKLMTRMKKTFLWVVYWVALFIMGMPYFNSLARAQWDFEKPKELDSEAIIKREAPQETPGEEAMILRPRVEYKAQGLKDPFLPPLIEKKTDASGPKAEEVKPLPALTVQGLIWGGEFPQAIVNSKVVRIGDRIGEVEVTGIAKDGLTVFFANREYKLPSPAATGQQPAKK